MKELSCILCLFLILSFAAQGCATGMADGGGSASITGTVRVVGNEPLTHVVVTVAKKTGAAVDYLITGPLEKELRAGYQGKELTVEGEFCRSPLPQFKKCFRPLRIVQSGDS